jgi:L-rhamnose mutarotase
MQRYGMVIGLNESKLEEYKKLHKEAWPEILELIKECNIRNFSIYLHKLDDAGYFLFNYFEYVGTDFEADMAKMKANPRNKEWWELTIPCQRPLENKAADDWWANMEEVFHLD